VTAAKRPASQILLDQRIPPFGSHHHQKVVVVRCARRPAEDVAFIWGIYLDHSSRNDADHRRDRHSVGADAFLGPNPTNTTCSY
jgi:hypothetical protein